MLHHGLDQALGVQLTDGGTRQGATDAQAVRQHGLRSTHTCVYTATESDVCLLFDMQRRMGVIGHDSLVRGVLGA